MRVTQRAIPAQIKALSQFGHLDSERRYRAPCSALVVRSARQNREKGRAPRAAYEGRMLILAALELARQDK
jgi:hypothetical protein